MTTRPRVQQLHQSTATSGQYLAWDGTTWAPITPSPVIVTRAVLTATAGDGAVFLGATPITNSDSIYVDGVLLAAGVDYTLSEGTVLLTSLLVGGETVVVVYFTSGSGGTPTIAPRPVGFLRPVAVTRPVRRYHRIR
jgi:hypothetical protein